MSNHRLISIGDAAKELGISKWQTRQLIRHSHLQGIALGDKGERIRYITRASLDALIERKEENHA